MAPMSRVACQATAVILAMRTSCFSAHPYYRNRRWMVARITLATAITVTARKAW